MLVNDLVAFPETHLGYFRFCSTLNFNICYILVIVVHASIDFGLMYHHDYSELEVEGGISNHLCMLVNNLVAFPETHLGYFCFFSSLNFNIWGFLVIVVPHAIDFGLMYYHDYSELEVVGGISNHLCMLVNDLVAFPETHLGYFRFCSTLNFNIWAILVIVVQAAIDFGLMYHHDYS
jgi:hypothetical protein